MKSASRRFSKYLPSFRAFSWRRFLASRPLEVARQGVALLLVYATVVATMPVRADELAGNFAGRTNSTALSQSNFFRAHRAVIDGSEPWAPLRNAESGGGMSSFPKQSLPLAALALPDLTLQGKSASLRSVLPHILGSFVGSGTSSTIQSNFNGTAIGGGKYIWFNSVLKPSGLGSSTVNIYLRSSTITFTANGNSYYLPVPGATITYSPSATTATTTFDTTTNQWLTTVPTSASGTGNTFLTGLSFPVPAGGLPGGINPVTWQGQFYTDTTGVSLNWQWAAAVYSTFTTTYSNLGVKPVDSNSASQYKNSDHAGTPESYKSYVIGGAQGGGGSNYTGSYSGTASVKPVVGTPDTPTANAGPNQTVYAGNTVQLNGTGSSDPAGLTLTYSWSLVSVPTGSTAKLNGTTSATPTFVADKTGSYTAQLVVNNGYSNSAPSAVVITSQYSIPIANAGSPQTVYAGATVQLNGSASSDPAGLPLTYAWSFASKPAGSAATLSGATTVTPTFVADKTGSYTVQLVANNGHNSSSPSTVAITSQYSTPVANAGPPQTVYVGTNVQLDGTGSSDPAGLPLTYQWSFISVPAGSTATLNGATASRPTFVTDKAGTYKVQLIVNNGHNSSPPSTVSIASQNQPPVANAGPPQTVYEEATVQLNGTGSYDPAGLSITYLWSFVSVPSGSNATLTGGTTPTPTFVADKTGTYKVQLVVNNGVFSSTPSTVVITTLNSPPVADAGPSQSVTIHSVVQLDGSHSTDVDGDPLTYSWSLITVPAGSKAALSNLTIVNPTFTVDVKGTYVAQLIVNDGVSSSSPSTVTISTLNTPPVANAGPNQTLTVTGTVQLDGSASTDVDGDSLTYSWSFLSVPAGSKAVLSNPNAVQPTFVADLLGTYVVQLIVNDGTVNSIPSTVMISSGDVPPVANPGPGQTVHQGSIVYLNGSASTDSDGQPLTYQWSLLSVPLNSTAALSQPTSVNPYFTVDLAGNYIVQLIVNDGYLSSSPATVTISTSNTAPVANAGANQSVTVGANVQLSGAGSSDADGDPLTHKWSILTQPNGGTAVLSSTTIVNPTFLANVTGLYVAQLIVNDGFINSQPATTTITVVAENQPPVVNAGPDQTITLPVNSVTLNGTATDDGLPNNTLTISWTQIDGPPGVTFGTPSQAVTTATFPGPGTYKLQLTANDSQLSSSSTTTVTVNPSSTNPPLVYAGPNQTVPYPNLLPLQGSVTSENNPPGTVTALWTELSGPPVTFANAASPTTLANFKTAGTYVLQLTGTEKGLSASSTVTITAIQGNLPPVVNAGPNQTITLPINSVTLNGTASDPQGSPLTLNWSQVTGPGTVSFSNAGALTTTASFSLPGTYILRLTAVDSALLTGSANVTVTVVTQNQPPVVSAGPDQTITLPNTATLNGTATDDGLPVGSTLTVQWAVVSGPGQVHFSSPQTPATQASFTAAGDYILSLSASDTQYTTTSTVKVSVAPPTAVITLSGPSAQLVGTAAAFKALVVDANNVPLSGTTVQFTVTGANPNSGSAITDATGAANFSYTGNSTGPDNVVSAISVNGSNLVSNTVPVNWVRPFNPVSTTSVHSVYFPSPVFAPNGQGSFGLSPGEQPLGVRDYPTLAFNASDTAAYNASAGLGGTTLPMANFTVDVNHQWTGTITEIDNNNHVYGIDYQVAYLGSFVVAAPGNVTFTVFSDDGFVLGIPGATEVSGPGNTVLSTTGVQGYPVLAGQNSVSNGTYSVVVNFPKAGIYPYEFDYFTDPFFSAFVVQTPGVLGAILALPPMVSLALTPNVATIAAGQQPIQVQALGVDGAPAAGVAVTLTVTGPNAQNLVAQTDAFGVARFQYAGSQAGDDRVQATALIDGFNAISNELPLHWNTSGNQPPTVNAGPSQTITLPANSVTLNGTVTDDGLPNGQLYSYWTRVSGPGDVPGDVTFSTPSYDPGSTFSATSNPSGMWTYGWEPYRGGTFTPDAVNASSPFPLWFGPAANFPVLGFNNLTVDYQSGTGLNAAGSVLLHPGPSGQNSVLRWTAPSSGTYLVQGRFFPEDLDGTTTDVAVLLNTSTQLMSGEVTGPAMPNAQGPGVPFNLAQTVNAGDTLDFTVGFGIDDNYSNDSTGLFLTIVPSGSPVTTAIFSLPGDYVLQLSATDTQYVSSSDVVVHVVPPACTTAPSGLVGWWPGDGNANDLISGNNGTIEGGLTFGAGEVGESFQLNGTDADAVIHNPPALGSQGLTMAAWVFSPSDQSSKRPILEYNSFKPDYSSGAQLWTNVDAFQRVIPGMLYANVMDTAGGSHVLASGLSLLHPLQWSHVAVTYDPTNGEGQLYINGLIVASGNLGFFTPQTTFPLYLGYDPLTSDRYSGGIDEVQLFNRTLSHAEVVELYAAGTLGQCKGNISQPPVVNAGPNQTITLPVTQVALPGSVNNPAGGPLTITWSEVSGPGLVSFANPASPATTANFNMAGVYDLRLSATTPQQTVSSDVAITVNGTSTLVVSAGANQTIQQPASTVTLNGSVSGAQGSVTLQWTQLSGPTTAGFSNPNAAVTQASFSAAGTYLLQLSASTQQLTGSATVSVVVLPAGSIGPVVFASASPSSLQLPSNLVNLTGTVQDSLPVTQQWSQVSGPATAVFSNPTALSTQATLSVVGTYVLQITASDQHGSSSASVSIVVQPPGSNQAPVVSIAANPPALQLPANAVTLVGTVTDDGLPVGAVVTQQWSQVSGPAPVTFTSPNETSTQATFSAAGTYIVALTASDTQLQTSAQATITVSSSPGAPPTVSITTPADDAEITAPTTVTGTVSNGNWILQYAATNETNPQLQQWSTFASGSGAASGSLAKFDPTILLNGEYTIQLVATDNFGQSASASVTVEVGRNMKLGAFSISFQDLSVPLPGLPITITRTYDSRDRTQGDFGDGWRLSIANVRIQKNGGPLGLTWDEEVSWSGLSDQYCLQSARNHTVTATFPDGRVYRFAPSTSQVCQLFAPIDSTNVTFVQVPTSANTAGAKLAPADGGAVLTDGSIPGPVNLLDYNGNPYDPTQFLLTTADGFTYSLDQKLGVTQVRDLNGNTLTINASGVVSSAGKSVAFTRDGQGRITQVADPSGAYLTYSYSGAGDLASVTDRAQNTTTFGYDGNHYLLNINDPRGTPAVRSTYDPSGRLLTTTDANGKTINYTQNIAGQIEQVQDRRGNTTTYAYDADGNILSMTDPLGNTTSYTYDSFDNKLTETNALHKTTTYTYDGLGNRLTEADPLGNTTTYTYNQRNQVLTVTDPQGHTTTNVYDANGNLLTSTDANGKTTTTVYAANGLPTSVTDAANNVTQFQYDGSGNLTQQTDALNHVSTYTYDANGNKLSQTVTRTVNGSPQTLTTGYQYDGNNRVTKTTYPDGSTTQVQYNSIGKQSATIDQLNRTTGYAYNADGNLITTTYPDTTTESTTYDANNNRLTSTDRAGHTTTYAYDADNRLTKTTYADTTFTQTAYDAAGRVASTTDANGHSTSYAYDAAGRRTSITDALTHVTTFTYDAAGNQATVQDANHNTTTYHYDALNRQVGITYPDNSTASTAYDALGRVSSKADQAGKVTGYGYDALGRLTSVTQDAGGLNLVTSYGYDEVGNRISQTDANNHSTAYSYDQNGRRIGRKLPAGQSESYVYDAAGNMKTKTDFNGKTTTYAYDTSNRLLSKTPDASFHAPTVGFTYTANGLRSTMSDVSGATTYGYDTRNRLTSKQTPFGTLSYTYDSAGDLLTLKSSNTHGISDTYTYDVLNRLSTVTDPAGATTYSYDAVGNLAGYTYPNGVVSSYNYDTLNRLTQMGSAKGAALSSYTYTLGAAGNRTNVAELSGRNVAYGYDSLYRLTSETVTADPHNHNVVNGYIYDSVGNRQQWLINGVTSNTYTYDADDRLGADSYDANGNTILSTGVSDSYDFENHLVQKGAVTIVYDGDGNRVAETVGGVTTNYLVDSVNPTGYAQVVDELQGNTVTRSYSYGMERISESQTLNSTWTPSFYGYDGHGSVRQLTNSAGATTDTYDYDAFGNLSNSTGSTPNNDLFAGEQYDQALGLYYNRARYLNTATGRFWSMDTYEGQVNDPLSLHKYLYTQANTVNLIDPSGRQIVDVEEAAAVNVTLETEPTAVQVGEALEGIVRATFADEANEAAAEATARLIQAAGVAVAVAATLIGVDAVIKQKAQECHCQSTPLYHYTDFLGALGIAESSFMFTSKAYLPDFPAGAYATDISPGANMTKQQLAAALYFDPGRQARAKNSWYVALCNDNKPGFEQLPATPRQWVKRGDYPGDVPVSPIIIGINPMPSK